MIVIVFWFYSLFLDTAGISRFKMFDNIVRVGLLFDKKFPAF